MQVENKFDGDLCCDKLKENYGSRDIDRSMTKDTYTINEFEYCPYCGKSIDATIKAQIKK